MELKKNIGIFETMRCFQGKIICLDWHLQRFVWAAKLARLRLTVSIRQLEREIYATVKLNQLSDASVRLTLSGLSGGAEIAASAKQYHPFSRQQYKRGFSAAVSSLRQDERSFFARIKSTQRRLFDLSLAQARKQGFDEAIILNQRGNICEGARTNIFFKDGSALFTPALSNGCLPGVTRRLVFDLARKNGLETYEGNFTLGDLCDADEAFCTNALIGIMPLTRLEEKSIGSGRIGKTSADFLKQYQRLLENEA